MKPVLKVFFLQMSNKPTIKTQVCQVIEFLWQPGSDAFEKVLRVVWVFDLPLIVSVLSIGPFCFCASPFPAGLLSGNLGALWLQADAACDPLLVWLHLDCCRSIGVSSQPFRVVEARLVCGLLRRHCDDLMLGGSVCGGFQISLRRKNPTWKRGCIEMQPLDFESRIRDLNSGPLHYEWSALPLS